jgi:hypothetical protein
LWNAVDGAVGYEVVHEYEGEVCIYRVQGIGFTLEGYGCEGVGMHIFRVGAVSPGGVMLDSEYSQECTYEVVKRPFERTFNFAGDIGVFVEYERDLSSATVDCIWQEFALEVIAEFRKKDYYIDGVKEVFGWLEDFEEFGVDTGYPLPSVVGNNFVEYKLLIAGMVYDEFDRCAEEWGTETIWADTSCVIYEDSEGVLKFRSSGACLDYEVDLGADYSEVESIKIVLGLVSRFGVSALICVVYRCEV